MDPSLISLSASNINLIFTGTRHAQQLALLKLSSETRYPTLRRINLFHARGHHCFYIFGKARTAPLGHSAKKGVSHLLISSAQRQTYVVLTYVF